MLVVAAVGGGFSNGGFNGYYNYPMMTFSSAIRMINYAKI